MVLPSPCPPGSRMIRRILPGAAAAGLLLGMSACSPSGSIESTDVPAWKATALPSASGIVLEDAGKILTRDPIVKNASNVPAGNYLLTISCDGGGKAFFAVALDGKRLTEAGAACNGSRESASIKVPAAGKLEVSASSVDAPLIYAYHLVPSP